MAIPSPDAQGDRHASVAPYGLVVDARDRGRAASLGLLRRKIIATPWCFPNDRSSSQTPAPPPAPCHSALVGGRRRPEHSLSYQQQPMAARTPIYRCAVQALAARLAARRMVR